MTTSALYQQNAFDVTGVAPWAGRTQGIALDVLDRALLGFYDHIRQNSRRLVNFMLAVLPLMALLVGSCKTTQLPWAYGGNADAAQFRIALFPDRVNYTGTNYKPAAGYVQQARDFVVGKPETLNMLTQEEVGFMFGTPALHRQDADAEIWQYKTASCVVDLYFYNDKEGHHSNVSYVDVRFKDTLTPGSAPRETPVTPAETSQCLQDVIRA